MSAGADEATPPPERAGIERSYSDREISLILRRAAEIDTRAHGGGGVSRAEIVAIAEEAGISRASVDRALEELRAEEMVTGSGLLPPASQRATRTLHGEASRADLAALVRRIEDRTGQPGSVTEALDTTRWTSRTSMHTIQVALSSAADETRIAVHERINDRARRLLYIVPANIAAMAGLITAGTIGFGTGGLLATFAAGALVGASFGRGLARRFADRSRRRVERLASDLVDDARQISASRAGDGAA